MSHDFAQQLIAWRRELHQFPELSNQEFATTERIKNWLRADGITLLPLDLATGVVAEIGQGEPLIALRADIDALPIEEVVAVEFRSRNAGVMHACGHDVHTSVMLGAARLLKAREKTLPGRVRLLFQPAEERFGGAKTLIAAGALQNVAAIFGMHNAPELPVGTFATRGGPFYANVDRFEIEVYGKGAHAARRKGSMPLSLPARSSRLCKRWSAAATARWKRWWSASRVLRAEIPGTCCRKKWCWKAPCAPTAMPYVVMCRCASRS